MYSWPCVRLLCDTPANRVCDGKSNQRDAHLRLEEVHADRCARRSHERQCKNGQTHGNNMVGKGKHEAKIQNRISIEVGIKVSSLGNESKQNANAGVIISIRPSFVLISGCFLRMSALVTKACQSPLRKAQATTASGGTKIFVLRRGAPHSVSITIASTRLASWGKLSRCGVIASVRLFPVRAAKNARLAWSSDDDWSNRSDQGPA